MAAIETLKNNNDTKDIKIKKIKEWLGLLPKLNSLALANPSTKSIELSIKGLKFSKKSEQEKEKELQELNKKLENAQEKEKVFPYIKANNDTLSKKLNELKKELEQK